MKMPCSVWMVLGWFELLTVLFGLQLLALQGMWLSDEGLDWMVRTHIVCIGDLAWGIGSVVAILRGRRSWVTVPCCLIGLMSVVAMMRSPPVSLVPGCTHLVAVLVLIVTSVLVALLYLPRADRWFTQRRMSVMGPAKNHGKS